MTAAAVEFRDISMRFGDKTALSGINLDIADGEFVVLLGPSGSGKTTLLNILGGFLEPSTGRVHIAGVDVTAVGPAKRGTTTVFQDYALFPHMSVAANIAFGLKMRNVNRAEQRVRVEAALAMVGLNDFGNRRIHELSGGQRQRIALARALIVEPSVLLLDEPLGALDMKRRRQMQDELKRIQQRVGTTFVHVTHDQEEAMAIADTIVVMNNGTIDDSGSPERIYLQPASRFSADFMGDNNLFEGEVVASKNRTVDVKTAQGVFAVDAEVEVGHRVALSLRPEHLYTTPGDNRVLIGAVEITETGFFGSHHQCTAKVDNTEKYLRIRLAQAQTLQPGDRLSLFANPAELVLLTR